MACDLLTTELAACASGIGKIESQTRLLQLIAQLSCEIAAAGGGGGGGTPSLPLNSVQFNNAGAFGGDASFTFAGAVLTVPDLLVPGKVSTSLRQLIDSPGGVSIDWENRIAVDNVGGTSLDWDNSLAIDPAGGTSLNWETRLAIDPSGITSLDWSNRQARDTAGGVSIDWQNRSLNDSGNSVRMDWELSLLFDAGSTSSINWDARQLLATNGTTIVLNFSSQQPSSGAQVAGAVYTAVEQVMIQEMYNAMRAYGLLS